jgi:hypothetical protein
MSSVRTEKESTTEGMEDGCPAFYTRTPIERQFSVSRDRRPVRSFSSQERASSESSALRMRRSQQTVLARRSSSMLTTTTTKSRVQRVRAPAQGRSVVRPGGE